MEPKEAIERIEDVLSSEYNYDETIEYQLTSDDFGWLEKAKEALEKQLPKKPVHEGKYNFNCPCCNNDLGVEREDLYVYEIMPPKLCADCGQRLDWSDKE